MNKRLGRHSDNYPPKWISGTPNSHISAWKIEQTSIWADGYIPKWVHGCMGIWLCTHIAIQLCTHTDKDRYILPSTHTNARPSVKRNASLYDNSNVRRSNHPQGWIYTILVSAEYKAFRPCTVFVLWSDSLTKT
ncbi:MAG: hypothetical protein NC453_26870 [Muribaculum sp.]|nr:hypothetical protein [Muribaculum sp.]